MDQEPETQEKPTVRPPDLSGPPTLSQPVLSQPSSVRPPDLSGPSVRAPDLAPPSLTPPTSVPAPSFTPPPPSPSSAPVSYGPPPSIPIPEEAKKKPKIEAPDPDEVLPGGIPTFNNRVIAAFIDFLVATGLYIAVTVIMPGILDVLGWVVSAAYLATRDSIPFLGGQSIGKKAMKLQAFTLDDKPLTGDWKTGVIRNILPMIPIGGLVELMVLLTREEKPERGRRLGDEWAKTKVIFIGDGLAATPIEEEDAE
jgi:uncharacterized RDD family membrane protein YckC